MEQVVPSGELTAEAVIEQVLFALGQNDVPYADAGIEVLYRFSSERMRAKVGDLSAFRRILHNDLFSPLLNFERVTAHAPEVVGTTARQAIWLYGSQAEVPFVVALAVASYGAHEGCWLISGITRGDIPLS